MKTNKSLPNGCIDDNNVAYTTKIEGYTTSMSYMKELYAIVSKRLTFTDPSPKSLYSITQIA